MTVYAGFPETTLNFLSGVRAHNHKTWFEAHRADYEAGYVAAGKAFVGAAEGVLRPLAPAINAEPRVNGSIFRINRDVRFSKDKTPYKDHLDLWFWEGERQRAVSGFFARVSPDLVGIGAGCHGFDRERLGVYRDAVMTEAGRELAAAVIEGCSAAGLTVEGATRVRAPRGYEGAPEPAATLLLYESMFAYREHPVELACNGRKLLAACSEVWSALAPLHRWLVMYVQRA